MPTFRPPGGMQRQERLQLIPGQAVPHRRIREGDLTRERVREPRLRRAVAIRRSNQHPRRAGPSGPGEHKVTKMLVVWKTSLPPSRSRLAASGTQRAGSHHKLAPHSEMARPKLREGNGTSAA